MRKRDRERKKEREGETERREGERQREGDRERDREKESEGVRKCVRVEGRSAMSRTLFLGGHRVVSGRC
jgi:hypothetical protein